MVLVDEVLEDDLVALDLLLGVYLQLLDFVLGLGVPELGLHFMHGILEFCDLFLGEGVLLRGSRPAWRFTIGWTTLFQCRSASE